MIANVRELDVVRSYGPDLFREILRTIRDMPHLWNQQYYHYNPSVWIHDNYYVNIFHPDTQHCIAGFAEILGLKGTGPDWWESRYRFGWCIFEDNYQRNPAYIASALLGLNSCELFCFSNTMSDIIRIAIEENLLDQVKDQELIEELQSIFLTK